MSSNSKVKAATFSTGLALVIPASIGLLWSGYPTVMCPFPLLTVLPAFLLSRLGMPYAAVAVPSLVFFLWHPGLFRGEGEVPRRSSVLLIAAIALSVADFAGGWKYVLQYQGAEHTRAVCLVNVAWAAFLVFAFARVWKVGSSFRMSLILHWLLFAWLGWYAFPYLGELP